MQKRSPTPLLQDEGTGAHGMLHPVVEQGCQRFAGGFGFFSDGGPLFFLNDGGRQRFAEKSRHRLFQVKHHRSVIGSFDTADELPFGSIPGNLEGLNQPPRKGHVTGK